jgi:FKBP-type peptidyl-prolyl cis-trans isomerase
VRLASGLDILEDHEGVGRAAQRGDEVTYNVRIFLNRGDEVLLNEAQAQSGLPAARLRQDGDRILIDHRIRLGRRRAIAGIDKALVGMKPGGHRRIRVGAHLAYRERGLPGLVPPNAVLDIDIWLRDLTARP